MKPEKLTSKILEKINPEHILYAEFAEGGAMGEAGTSRLFVLDGKTLHFYLVSLSNSSTEEDIHAYADVYTFLRDLEHQKTLHYVYAGFGNHAWKNKNVEFTRDDDSASFIYTINKSEFSLPASVRGVYFHTVSEFAIRPADLKLLTKFRKKVLKSSTREELAFYDAYLEQIERNDQGNTSFNIDVDDYWCAINYIRYLNLEAFNLSDDDITSGISAIQKYRLKYLIAKLGWRTFDKFMAELAELKSTDLFFETNKFINALDNPHPNEEYVAFNINNLFHEIRYVSSSRTSLSPYDSKSVLDLFEYPVLVKFTDAAHQDILSSITKATAETFHSDGLAMSYYIANFIFSEDTLSYADILPACAHIIEDLPTTDPQRVHLDHLFWLASEVIDRIWRYASENKATQKHCRNLIYDLFSPRVGGLWPIVHYDEFKFKEPTADSIFKESLSFVMSLDDICERSQDIKNYLDLYRKGYKYPLPSVERRAFFETLRDYESSEEKFEHILKNHAAQEYPRYLCHPSTVKEATRVLDELFRTDEGARITGLSRIGTFEQLLINGNSIGVGVAILNHLVANFDLFSSIITSDCEIAKLDPLYVITTIYTAAASGATEENELPPLKALTKKIAKYVTKLQIEQTMHAGSLKGMDIRTSEIDVDAITEAALRYARKHRRTILFQRSALQKFF